MIRHIDNGIVTKLEEVSPFTDQILQVVESL